MRRDSEQNLSACGRPESRAKSRERDLNFILLSLIFYVAFTAQRSLVDLALGLRKHSSGPGLVTSLEILS